MKYKILTVDKNGIIELKPEELEKMLEEAYQEGKDSVKPEIVYVPTYYPNYYDTKRYWWDTTPYVWTAQADSAAATGINTTTYSTPGSTTIKADNKNDTYSWCINNDGSNLTTTQSKPTDFITYTK